MPPTTSKPPVSPPARIGQTRADKQGGTIILAGFASQARYVCEYPQLDGETHIYSAQTIEQLYPIIVSEPR